MRRFYIVLIFFEIFLSIWKNGHNAGMAGVARGEILQNSWWIYDEMDTCIPSNDFWKNKEQTIKHM